MRTRQREVDSISRRTGNRVPPSHRHIRTGTQAPHNPLRQSHRQTYSDKERDPAPANMDSARIQRQTPTGSTTISAGHRTVIRTALQRQIPVGSLPATLPVARNRRQHLHNSRSLQPSIPVARNKHRIPGKPDSTKSPDFISR